MQATKSVRASDVEDVEVLDVEEVDHTELDEQVECCLSNIDDVLAEVDAIWTEEQIWAQIGRNAENAYRVFKGVPDHSYRKARDIVHEFYSDLFDRPMETWTEEEKAKLTALNSCTC